MRSVWVVVRRRSVAPLLAGMAALLGMITLAAAPLGESLLHRTPTLCGLPGLPDPATFSVPGPGDLPWRDAPPPELVHLQRRWGAGRLVGAYQIQLTETLFDEVTNVRRGAELLRGAVLQPGERFSFNRRVGPFTAERGFRDGPEYRGGQVVPSPGGGICKLSSALLNAAVLAGLTVVERHPHSMLVAYVPAGQDAAVAYPHKDLRLRSDQAGPVVIWADYRDDRLTVALYGAYDPPAVEWSHEILDRQPFPEIRRPQPGLPAGRERILVRGLDGLRIRSRLTVVYADGRRVSTDWGVTHYRPRSQVVEYGT